MKASLVIYVALLLAASAAHAESRSGYKRQPFATLDNPKPFMPWRPAKPYSVYGDDPTSLTPRAHPYSGPYFKPYTGSRTFDNPSVFEPSGGALGRRRSGTF